MFEIMNARDNETLKVSHLFIQKEVKRHIYYIEKLNLT